MFNKKLNSRISELEVELKAEKELSDDTSRRLNEVTKSFNDSTKLVETLQNDLEKATEELDIYRQEREELKNKYEENIDKDALIQLLTMKNHDLEVKISNMRNDMLRLACEKAGLVNQINAMQMSYYSPVAMSVNCIGRWY